MLRRLIKALFPRAMDRIEAESRSWTVQCPNCGYATSIWEAGGMRYKGLGPVYRLGRCRSCGKIGMLRLYQRGDPAR